MLSAAKQHFLLISSKQWKLRVFLSLDFHLVHTDLHYHMPLQESKCYIPLFIRCLLP